MTVVSLKYKQWKTEAKCLCDLSVGDFFQFPREQALYRMINLRSDRADVLCMETLEMDTHDVATAVHRVKVKEVNISVEFESE